MSKTIMPEMAPELRYQFLKDNAEHMKEDAKYYRDLTPEDLDGKREKLSQNLIDISNHEDDLSKVKAEFKGLIEPLKADNKILLECVKTRKEEVEGVLFYLANHEEGLMEEYDVNGEMISSRPLRLEEKQLKAFPLKVIGQN